MKLCITRSQRFVYSETFIRNQISGLQQRTPVWTLHSGRLPEKEEDGSWLSPLPLRLAGKLLRVLTGHRNNYFTERGLVRYWDRHHIDLILANYGLSAAHLVQAARKRGIPVVPHFHGYDASMHKVIKEYGAAYRQLFEWAPAIVAVSTVMKQKLVALGAPEEKVKVIPYGIDIDQFSPQPALRSSDLIFLSVGRFTAKKGPQVTIRAFARVLRDFPQATLVMAGSHDGLYEECRQLADELDVLAAIRFVGVQDSSQIAIWMQQATVFVQHSVTPASGDMEGTPLSILEAAASGLPVVSTRHGGILEAVVEGETGFLVDEYDEEGMARQMKLLAGDRALAARMGESGREHIAANYNRAYQLDKLFQLLQSVAGRK